MPIEVILPALSAGMEGAVIARWLKAEGDLARQGDVIAELESDKATMEVEATADGTVAKLLFEEGAFALVNKPIAILLEPNEKAASPVAIAPSTSPKPRHAASPLARRLAEKFGLSLTGLKGSGPNGRIVRVDVEVAPRTVKASESNSAAPEPAPRKDLAIPAEPVGAEVAVSVPSAVTTTASSAHFHLQTWCAADRLFDLRSRINGERTRGTPISLTAFFVKAAAVSLHSVPQANRARRATEIVSLDTIGVRVAAASDSPSAAVTIADADRRSVSAICAALKTFAGQSRTHHVWSAIEGEACLTVSNLGMYGMTGYIAAIDPGQSATLAIGMSERRPIERDGQLAFTSQFSVTLSADREVLDPILAAKLLGTFKRVIEEPIALLV